MIVGKAARGEQFRTAPPGGLQRVEPDGPDATLHEGVENLSASKLAQTPGSTETGRADG